MKLILITNSVKHQCMYINRCSIIFNFYEVYNGSEENVVIITKPNIVKLCKNAK